jgi:hypothetical protein
VRGGGGLILGRITCCLDRNSSGMYLAIDKVSQTYDARWRGGSG